MGGASATSTVATCDDPHRVACNCVVNSRMNLQVIMRETDEGRTTGNIDVPPNLFTHLPHEFNGHFELKFVFVTPTIVNDTQVHRSGRLIIDDSIVHELGPLQRLSPVESAVLLSKKPATIRFDVVVVETPAVHPSEALLARHCLALLVHEEFGGSFSSSHLQNQVRDLPYYADVIGPIKPSWIDFVRAHADKWSVFKYTAEEIEQNNISTTCRNRELRIVANEHLDEYRQGDIARERVRVRAESELNDLLEERLRERKYEQSELLKELVNEKSFLSLITPNLTKVLGMFEQHPEEYWVLCHRLHPIIVEPRVVPVPTQDDMRPTFDRFSRELQYKPGTRPE